MHGPILLLIFSLPTITWAGLLCIHPGAYSEEAQPMTYQQLEQDYTGGFAIWLKAHASEQALMAMSELFINLLLLTWIYCGPGACEEALSC